MTTLTFDTLAYAKKLRAAGFTYAQAEAQAETIIALMTEQLATKVDLKEVEAALKRDIKELEVKIKELETSLKHDMKEMELRLKHDLTLRLGGMLAAGIGIFAAIVKLIH